MLDLEDDEPQLDDNDFPHNPKKQLNLELSTIDLTPEAEHMKVYLRIRPFFNEELHIGEDQVYCVLQSITVILRHSGIYKLCNIIISSVIHYNKSMMKRYLYLTECILLSVT